MDFKENNLKKIKKPHKKKEKGKRRLPRSNMILKQFEEKNINSIFIIYSLSISNHIITFNFQN